MSNDSNTTQRDELARDIFLADNSSGPDQVILGDWTDLVQEEGDASYAHRIANGLSAAGYRKPRTITTAEELDALEQGAVVISPEYRHYRNGMQVSFQKWDDGRWYRGGRGRDTHPEYFLPATVLHEPEAEATR